MAIEKHIIEALQRSKWFLPNIDTAALNKYISDGCHPVVAQILAARKIDNLEPDIFDLHDPFLMLGMDAAVERIKRAADDWEKVAVWGDYDVDGTTATAILYLGLKKSFPTLLADFYIPNRQKEGYGLNKQGIERIASTGTTLLITVDSGITGVEEVAFAKSLGMDVIITDHHHVPQVLPKADVVINQHQPGETYPFVELCGAGIAFKLIQALIGNQALEFVDLAGLGTMADMVSLTGENRVIASLGMERMRHYPNLGLRSIATVANIPTQDINSGNIGFQIVPRVNTIGRLEDATVVAHLFTESSAQNAKEVALYMDEKNTLRKQITAEVERGAVEQIEAHPEWHEHKILIAAGENWHTGVVGIVANRLVERYHKPALVIGIQGDHATGSARSIPSLNLMDTLYAANVFSKVGGHEMAAGFSLSTDKIDTLRERLWKIVDWKLRPDDLFTEVHCDAVVQIKDLTLSLLRELERLEPFGMDNPEPTFIIEQVKVTSMMTMGKNHEHIKVRVSDDTGRELECVSFNAQSQVEIMRHAFDMKAYIRLAGTLGRNDWRGNVTPQFQIKDWRFHNHIVDESSFA